MCYISLPKSSRETSHIARDAFAVFEAGIPAQWAVAKYPNGWIIIIITVVI